MQHGNKDLTDKIFHRNFHGNAQRLDLWLAEQLPELSRSKVQKLIERQCIRVNGKLVKASFKLQDGDIVDAIIEAEASSLRLVPHTMPLDIVYEDEALIVLNKAAGITVHPGAGTTAPTLVEGVLAWLGRAGAEGSENIRPGVVHRLDKDTTGLMVYAKSEYAHFHLAKQFAAKQIPREYLALLDGYLALPRLEYESYLFRDPSHRQRFASLSLDAFVRRFPGGGQHPGFRWAKSVFERQQSFGERISLAKISLYTGRTHQIRVHAKALQCPVLGDQVYNQAHEFPQSFSVPIRRAVAGLKRQMLHAFKLGFIHPLSGQEMHFSAPPPRDFQDLVDLLAPFQDEKKEEE